MEEERPTKMWSLGPIRFDSKCSTSQLSADKRWKKAGQVRRAARGEARAIVGNGRKECVSVGCVCVVFIGRELMRCGNAARPPVALRVTAAAAYWPSRRHQVPRTGHRASVPQFCHQFSIQSTTKKIHNYTQVQKINTQKKIIRKKWKYKRMYLH